jgi:hypothetical protein
MVPPEQASAQKWDGKWLCDSEAEIVIKSREDEVEVSGTATWGAATLSVSRGEQFTPAKSMVAANHGLKFWPLVMIPIDHPSRLQRIQVAPRSWSYMAHI